jgi:hypothetical protein
MYTDRIVRGGARLDNQRPGWRDGISLPDLNMAGCRRCVLGQALGDFRWYPEIGLTFEQTVYYGFRLGDSDYSVLDKRVSPSEIYADLTREWRAYIASTRTEAA